MIFESRPPRQKETRPQGGVFASAAGNQNLSENLYQPTRKNPRNAAPLVTVIPKEMTTKKTIVDFLFHGILLV
jgi:hypothetical protein